MLKSTPRELQLARPGPRGVLDTVAFDDVDAASMALGEPAVDPGPELRALFNPFTAAAEQFRTLRSQLSLHMGAPVAGRGQVLAVVGAERGVGRSFVAVNLAVSMAQRGGRVLLVDADLRHPRLHRLFGLRAADGLAAMLDGSADHRSVRAVAPLPALHLLGAGVPPVHPLELVERPEFALVMCQLRLRFSHIVLDTPAACDGPDAAIVSANADGALLVVQRHRSEMAALQRLQQALHLAGTAVVGAVDNAH
ncbi:MAG: CpsD/CapB family tyrosine-protein kinase [Rubrivivax sp.]|nr:CpsD/CapB family tyrosine-protein kinase [Rubrivivax sp.]